MDFSQLIGAIGIGAILTKILDIVWLQKALEKKERLAWLREKRIEAFSGLAKELISFGLHDKKSGLSTKSRFSKGDILNSPVFCSS